MYQELQQIIDTSRRIVFFGGAGVSTESGIPDFRSVDGLYNQHYAWPPETILSATFFRQHTEEFYRFYREKMLPLDAQPNAAHRFLADLERAGRLTAVVTQNIDGLHQQAGSRNVLELHGSIHRNRCLKCAQFYPPEYIRDSTGIPRCDRENEGARSDNKYTRSENRDTRSVCNGIIKPEVVLYEEGLDDDVLSAAVHHIRTADTLIVAGTSLTVYPAAGLVHYFRGKHLVLINRDATPMDDQADLVIHDSVGKVFSTLTIKED